MGTTTATDTTELEERFTPELRTRTVGPWTRRTCVMLSVVFAIYHYYTAGFGIPADYWHMGIHLAGVLPLIFVLYPFVHRRAGVAQGRYCPGGVPLHDWLCGLIAAVAALYIGATWRGVDLSPWGIEFSLLEQALRQGNPAFLDLIMGTALIVLILEATRRTMGSVLPLIILVFMGYALFGPHMPIQILQHPGVSWGQFINNIYFPAEGIYGITLWVVSTIVFHFVLFGVIAQRMGLGQFFIDLATVFAGRFTGGPAKVSVVASAFFGTISGSSVANTVSTGSLTIPNMKRLGYTPHFAGGVEAAASAGGQITPPIMGAAAFIMAENLEMPYSTLVIAAAIPALMHYVGVLTVVHFEAKRLGLAGFSADQIPKLWQVLKTGWPTLIPLVALIYVLFSGRTPYMAAFWGITLCIAVGLVNPYHRLSLRDLFDAFALGTKYALAVGAAAAAVGIVVGVITTTGVAFRLGFMVTSGAVVIAEGVQAALAWLPVVLFSLDQLTLFISLVLIAAACIFMGAGLPTTALYIMLAAVAQPALANLGVPPLAAHLFVLYYGVIAEITPPVCTSAYAAGGIAGANPFRTGLSAFALGNAKLMVPLVFVYSPAMLLVLPDYFTWGEFLTTTLTCIIGVAALGMALAGYALVPLKGLARGLVGAGGVLLVMPGVITDLYGGIPVALVLGWQWIRGPKVVIEAPTPRSALP
ncbi:MAG: TRAP transporter permease [Candidatus Competibacterales bacterium]